MSHRILIVEDDLAMAQLLIEGLTRRGYQPQAAHSGEAALAAMQQELRRSCPPWRSPGCR